MSGFHYNVISPEETDEPSPYQYIGEWIRGPPKGFSWTTSPLISPSPQRFVSGQPAAVIPSPIRQSMSSTPTEPEEFPEGAIEMV
jgi:hypothetical protein